MSDLNDTHYDAVLRDNGKWEVVALKRNRLGQVEPGDGTVMVHNLGSRKRAKDVADALAHAFFAGRSQERNNANRRQAGIDSVDTSSLRPMPAITAERENYRLVPLPESAGFRALVARRDPVEPVPVGTYIVMCFRVAGYDPDCDGSLMARLEAVGRDGEGRDWEVAHLGLYPDSSLVVDEPDELWRTAGA